VRIRGALHVHSKHSRDGTMTIAELAQWYGQNGYQFLAMGEHAEDLNEPKVEALREQSAENSNAQFCVIPGIEFAATRDIHIVGIGVERLIPEMDSVDVVREIHGQGGFAILAHPKRFGWACPPDVLLAVDAAEIWNVGYDGKYLPSPKAMTGFREMRQINPKLLAVASHDFHKRASFYDVSIEMNVTSLTPGAILHNLRQGSYRIRSAFFSCDPDARMSGTKTAFLCHLSRQLSNLRRARTALLRWSP
jgi:predicted metal-dependent phosphoesterase TrpH